MVLFVLASDLSEQTFDKASRRLANMSFVLWQATLFHYLNSAYYIFDRCMLYHESNIVVECIDYNQLLFFVFINLQTGIVNLSLKTLFIEYYTA